MGKTNCDSASMYYRWQPVYVVHYNPARGVTFFRWLLPKAHFIGH